MIAIPYIIGWVGLGFFTHLAIKLSPYLKPKPKTKDFDSKEPFKPIDNITLSKPIELEHVPIEEVEVEYIHSITWNARTRQVTDIEFKNLV